MEACKYVGVTSMLSSTNPGWQEINAIFAAAELFAAIIPGASALDMVIKKVIKKVLFFLASQE